MKLDEMRDNKWHKRNGLLKKGKRRKNEKAKTAAGTNADDWCWVCLDFICCLRLFKIRFLGILIANGFRIIAGNTYQILCLLLAVLGFWIVIKNTEFSIGKTDAGLAAYSFISVSYYCYMPIYLANSILGNQISWGRHGIC